MLVLRTFICFFVATSVLGGCQSNFSESIEPPSTDWPVACQGESAESIYDSVGQLTDFNTVIRRSAAAGYVLIGEVHTNSRHHEIQARVVSTLGNTKRFNTVLFEMLEPAHDEPATGFRTGTLSIADLNTSLQWDERGWPIWDAYAPIFLTAKQSGLKITHGGMDSELVRHVNSYGFLALPRRMRQELEIKPDEEFVVDFEDLKAEVTQPHQTDPATGIRLTIAQYAKDAYMARQLLSSGDRAILIAGNGHVRNDIGVPGHLRKYQPSAQILIIGLIEDPPEKAMKANYFANNKTKKRYDFLWFTSPSCASSLAR